MVQKEWPEERRVGHRKRGGSGPGVGALEGGDDDRGIQLGTVAGLALALAFFAMVLTGLLANASTSVAADPDGPGHGCPDCMGGPEGQGSNGSGVDNDDVKQAGIIMNAPSCVAGVCGPAGYLGLIWGGPALALPVVAICAIACDVAYDSGAFNQQGVYSLNASASSQQVRFNVKVDPTSDRTWTQQRAILLRRLAARKITESDAKFLTRHFQAVGRKAEKMVPAECYNEQGTMICKSWVKPLQIARNLQRFTVNANVSGSGSNPAKPPNGMEFTCTNGRVYQSGGTAYRQKGNCGSGSSNPAKPPNGAEFTCTNGRDYQSGGSAYRQKGNGGAVKCPGVQLPLHVYCNDRVVGVIQPNQADGTGSC